MLKLEANLLKGMEEMEDDRKKKSLERSGYVGSNFMEEYHYTVDCEEQPQKKRKQTKDNPEAEGKKRKKDKNCMSQSDDVTTTKEEVQRVEKSKMKKESNRLT